MKTKGQAGLFSKVVRAILIYGCVAFILAGCAAESPNPLAVENLNGDPPKQEMLSLELDGRGFINGVFQPGKTTLPSQIYPINYTGNWELIYMTRSRWYMAMTEEAGARIDIVATMSRVVFDFWDYEFYDDPGKVTFLIDDRPLGTFDLARAREDGQKFLNYQITTQKNDVATISMILESGRVVVTGYLINSLDPAYQY